MSSRGTGWQSQHRHRPHAASPQPPPSPRILHLQRRCRRTRHQKPLASIRFGGKPPSGGEKLVEDEEEVVVSRGKLETLFGQERAFSRSARVVLLRSGHKDADSGECGRCRGRVFRTISPPSSSSSVAEEGWRFQVEVLRAECNLLRMERDLAEKKLGRTSSEMEKWLRMAVDTLNSEKGEIPNSNSAIVTRNALKKKVRVLEKIADSQRRSGRRKHCNFDRETSFLRRRLKELEMIEDIEEDGGGGGGGTTEEVSTPDGRTKLADVAVLGKKLENLSTGMIQSRRAALQIEAEFRSLLTLSATTDSGRSTKSKHRECSAAEKDACPESCRETIQRIAAHIHVETEQWSQMQRMLHQVKEEMEDLQASRDLWQSRAVESDRGLQSLETEAETWKQRALHAESKASEMQKQILDIQSDLGSIQRQLPASESRDSSRRPAGPGSQRDKEMEKRVLVCRLKENSMQRDGKQGLSRAKTSKEGSQLRQPLREVGNERLSRCRKVREGVVLKMA